MSTAKKIGLKLRKATIHGGLEFKLKLDEPASVAGLSFKVGKANRGSDTFTLTVRAVDSSCPEGEEPPQSPQPA